jgi:SAM-dependent methyltransferase
MNNSTEITSLDMGCGSDKQKNSLGLDIFKSPHVDVVANMNFPMPFKDESFHAIYMIDSLEHVEDVAKTLSEASRILKQSGVINVRTPHFSSLHAYSDFTHKQFFSVEGLKSLLEKNSSYQGYGVNDLTLIHVRLKLWKAWRLLGVELFANLFTQYYEKLFAFWFPAMCIEFSLTKETK